MIPLVLVIHLLWRFGTIGRGLVAVWAGVLVPFWTIELCHLTLNRHIFYSALFELSRQTNKRHLEISKYIDIHMHFGLEPFASLVP